MLNNKSTHLLNFPSIFILLLSLIACTEKPHRESNYNVNTVLKSIEHTPGYYNLDEMYLAPNAASGVIIISEPHSDIQGQWLLGQFLKDFNDLNRNPEITLFCVESAAGSFDLTQHRERFQSESAKYKALVLDGLFSGWELHALTNPRISLVGIENPATYLQQVGTFSNNYKTFRNDIIAALNDTLTNLRQEIFILRAVIQHVVLGASNDDALGDYQVLLAEQSDSGNLSDLQKWFGSKTELQHQNYSKVLDELQKACVETDKTRNELSREYVDRFDSMYPDSSGAHRLLVEHFLTQKRIELFSQQLPTEQQQLILDSYDFVLKSAMLHEESEFAAQEFTTTYTRLFDEICTECQTFNRLLVDRLVAIHEALAHVRRNSTDPDYHEGLIRLFANDSELCEKIRENQELLSVARIRDSEMAENTLRVMRSRKEPFAMMFIGNFHRPGITSYFKKRGVSYLYYENTAHYQMDMDLYIERLKGVGLKEQTMPPSYLHPIIYPNIKSEFVKHLDNMNLSVATRKINAYELSDQAFLDRLKVVDKLKAAMEDSDGFGGILVEDGIDFVQEFSSGASGDRVFEIAVKDDITGKKIHLIVKLFTEKEKGERDIHNTKQINQYAVKHGYGKLYADYLVSAPVIIGGEELLLTVQEKIEGATLRERVDNDDVDELLKKRDVERFFERAAVVDKVTTEILAEDPNALRYPTEVITYRDFHQKLKSRLRFSKALNDRVYREQPNRTALQSQYSTLEQIIDKFFDRTGEFEELEVSRDMHFGNFFLEGDGIFIDSADDIITAANKSKALQIKEAARVLLDMDNDRLDDPANNEVIGDILTKVLGEDLDDNTMAEVIGFLYAYDFSDSKQVLKDHEALLYIWDRNLDKSDADKCADLARMSDFFKDRQQKNYLILLLLKNYNDKFNKGIDDELKEFNESYEKGIIVFRFDTPGIFKRIAS